MNDPMFFNKIAAALLTALLLFFGLPQLSTALRGGGHGGGHEAEESNPFPQYPVAYGASEGAGGGGEAVPADFATLLASADPAAGGRRAGLCKSCHTLDKGGANGTGPNLWGVVGRAVAGHEGFNYTGALKAAGGDWTFERLSDYLENSQGYIPGTAMVQRFPKAEQRAEIIAYLNTLSDNPLPLPTPAAAPAAEGGEEEHAAAEGATETAAEETPAEAVTTEAPAEEHSGH